VAQVVAASSRAAIGYPVTTTDTSKVPNTSATAASSSSDLNGMAARAAARSIRQRLLEHACETHGVSADQVRFADGQVDIGARSMTFGHFVRDAHAHASRSLPRGTTGLRRFTATVYPDRPAVLLLRVRGGRCGSALDTLSGETRLLRVDILHDVGASLNPAIDRGQIEGAFIQGVGWLTCEELWWDAKGELQTHAPSTYKIPTARDWPAHSTVTLPSARRTGRTIHRSKAVGEPPLMLAISVFHAISRRLRRLRTRRGAAAPHRSGYAGSGAACHRQCKEHAMSTRVASDDAGREPKGRWLRRCATTGLLRSCRLLEGREPAVVRVLIGASAGFRPRASPRCMLVSHSRGRRATIGGGNLEWQAIAGRSVAARGRTAPSVSLRRLVLGRELGQCCGGVVQLWMERFTPADLPRLAAVVRADALGTSAALVTSLSGQGVRSQTAGARIR